MDDWQEFLAAPEKFQVIGLTLNIVGVYFIVNSLIFKKPRRFLYEHFRIDRKQSLVSIRSYVMSQVQLVIGFVFVIAGYFLQVAYHLSITVTDRSSVLKDPSVIAVGAILIASMATVTLLLKVIQIFWTRHQFKRLLTEFFRENDSVLDKYPATAKEVGGILGVNWTKEDSVAEYLKRLKAFLEIESEPPKARGSDSARSRSEVTSERVPVATHPATPPRILS